jgi:signal transduction histidine kinase
LSDCRKARPRNPAPTRGILAVAFAEGEPVFWKRWWLQLSCALAVIFAILVFHRYRVRQLTRQLNVRFEERLAERTRIAQELHDTLLQGFLNKMAGVTFSG